MRRFREVEQKDDAEDLNVEIHELRAEMSKVEAEKDALGAHMGDMEDCVYATEKFAKEMPRVMESMVGINMVLDSTGKVRSRRARHLEEKEPT